MLQQPREWTDGEFKVIEWLSAQCALALQAIEYQQEVLVKRREAEEAVGAEDAVSGSGVA